MTARRRRVASKPPLELRAYQLSADARTPTTGESNDLRKRGIVRIAKEKPPRSLERGPLTIHCQLREYRRSS